MTFLDRWTLTLAAVWADPRRLRLVTGWVVAVVAAWSCVLSVVLGGDTGALVAPFVILLGALSARLSSDHRSMVLGLIAGGATLWSAEVRLLVPVAIGCLALAVLESPRAWLPVPWILAAVGAVCSVIVYSGFGSDVVLAAPVIAVACGGAAGMLLRTAGRAGVLQQEAGVLRGQATWLEQRTALARELHDVVGHHVTAMVVQAEAGLVADRDRALREIADLGRTALGELDALVVHLRDPDAPLATSAPPRLLDIDELLAAPLRAQGVQVGVHVDDALELDEVRVLAVYRIVQEALTNVARHARASAAAVDVRAVSGHLRVRVSDDGVGAPAEPERGSGLVGIGERVGAHGGFWELSQRLGGGTVLDVVLPFDEGARAGRPS